MPDIWFNPRDSVIFGRNVIGVEWSTVRNGQDSFAAGLARGFLQRFRSSTAETVNQVALYSRGNTTSGRVGVEVFTVGSELSIATPPFSVRVPNGVANAVGVLNQSGGAATAAQVADDNFATYHEFTHPASGTAHIDYEFGGAAPTGRVVGIKAEIFGAAGGSIAFGAAGQRYTLDIVDTAGNVLEHLGVVAPGLRWEGGPNHVGTTSFTPTIGQIGSVFLSPAIITSLNNPATRRLRVSFGGAVVPGDIGAIYKINLWVHTVTENRLAAGIITTGVAGPTWHFGSLLAPDQVANWAKPVSVDLSMLVRPLPAQFQDGTVSAAQWAWVEGADDHSLGLAQPANAGTADVVLDSFGRVAQIKALNKRRFHNFAPITTAPATSIDTMPYTGIAGSAPTSALQLVQSFTPPLDKTYQAVRLPVLRTNDIDAATPKPTKQLYFVVEDDTTGALVGQGYIEPASFDDPSVARDLVAGWKMVDIPFNTPVALTGGVKYRVEVGAQQPEAVWLVGFLDTSPTAAPAGINDRTWGGTVHQGGFTPPTPPTYLAREDLMVSLVATADPVTGFSGFVGEQLFENLAGCGDCEATMPYARLRWSPHLEAAISGVGTYELQRRDPIDPTWRTIRVIAATSGAVDGADDYETYPDVTSEWRVRYVRPDTSYSPWSTTVSLEVGGGPPIAFVSNARPELNVAYGDAALGDRPTRIYDYLDTVDYREHHGRDMQTGFLQAECRGVSFERTLLVPEIAPAVGGVVHFEPLYRIARLGKPCLDDPGPAIPYVCVRERHGGRFYAGLRIRAAEIIVDEPAPIHFVTVEVTEVRDKPVAAS